MTDQPVTRGEFDMLRAAVRENGQRLEAIDASGTRGVNALAVQVADLIKDVSEIRNDQREHRREHEDEARTSLAARRWLVTTLIALFIAMEAPLAWVAAHVH